MKSILSVICPCFKNDYIDQETLTYTKKGVTRNFKISSKSFEATKLHKDKNYFHKEILNILSKES
jgi:hypothetical protein